jgi:hypothetical protein
MPGGHASSSHFVLKSTSVSLVLIKIRLGRTPWTACCRSVHITRALRDGSVNFGCRSRRILQCDVDALLPPPAPGSKSFDPWDTRRLGGFWRAPPASGMASSMLGVKLIHPSPGFYEAKRMDRQTPRLRRLNKTWRRAFQFFSRDGRVILSCSNVHHNP